jgi:hypothetical protein
LLDRELELQRRIFARTLSDGPERSRRAISELQQRRVAIREAWCGAAAEHDQASCDLGILEPS